PLGARQAGGAQAERLMARRLAAAAALVLTLATVVLAITVAVNNFPRGITVLACVVVALLAAWWGIAHHGAARAIGLGLGALLLLGAVALVVFEGKALQDLLVLLLAVLALEMARRAFLSRADLPAAPRPERAVLFYNPKSGGGKATRFHLADEARKRGIEAVELKLGEDLRELVRRAIADGADALAMAGGDGSQAIVADEAAAHGLPYACIPSGTRNHFALDLGVDRDDVVGALDALVDGRERVVDLAEVNGRVFVNNVSLGVYAEAVQRQGYREAKLRTIADTAPEVLGPGAGGLDLRWAGPDGRENRSGAVLLVSNDPYRMGHASAPRHGHARHRGDGSERRRPEPAVVVRHVPGRLRRQRGRRHRRRGGQPRAAAGLPLTAGCSAGAHRAPPSRRVAFGADPRGPVGRRSRPCAHRVRSRHGLKRLPVRDVGAGPLVGPRGVVVRDVVLDVGQLHLAGQPAGLALGVGDPQGMRLEGLAPAPREDPDRLAFHRVEPEAVELPDRHGCVLEHVVQERHSLGAGAHRRGHPLEVVHHEVPGARSLAAMAQERDIACGRSIHRFSPF